MTREQSIQVLSLLKVAYPRFYTNLSKDDAENAISLWTSMLSDHCFDVIKLAVQKYIAQGKFPPTIADIRESLVEVTERKEMLADEAWGQAIATVRKYGSYREEEALASMDSSVSTLIKRLGYKTLCMTEDDQIMTFRAHFIKLWDSNLKNKKSQAMIPIEFKQRMDLLTNNIKMIGGCE